MYTATREELLKICRLVYDRHLTNSAGSNFSARATADTLYMSMSGNAKHNRLRMSPDELLHTTFEGEVLEGKGGFSQSWPTHLKMYKEFECVGAVIHAHPKLATALACRQQAMPPLLDAMKKYGEIPVLSRDLKVDSTEFGEAIATIFKKKGKSFEKHGHAVLYPYHGVLVAAPNLDDAYDCLERIEYNAHAILANALLNISGGYKNLDMEIEGASLE